MPERVHRRFDDDPPAKRIKLNGTTATAKDEEEDPGKLLPEPIAEVNPRKRAHDYKVKPFQPRVAKDTPPYNHAHLKERAQSLLVFRRQLPIWSHATQIRQSLRSKDVMLLVGETGSGKSTQIPQFLVEESWCKLQKVTLQGNADSMAVSVGGCIAITEPRRVAAITLARRVAEEMGTPLGSSSPASKVGYSVRFDSSTSPSTRIKFLTEGMLLQEMLRDPWLRQYSAVIVDEVHERGINVDLVMGFLRNMVYGKGEGRGGIPLKVVVMSATADMEGLQKFFEDGSAVHEEAGNDIESTTLAAENLGERSESEWSGCTSSDDEIKSDIKNNPISNGKATGSTSRQSKNPTSKKDPDGPRESEVNGQLDAAKLDFKDSAHVSICYIEGRQYPVKTIYSPEPAHDYVDAALRTIFQIHYKEPLPGDILVFLTGQETVESLESLVKEYALSLGPELPKIMVLTLFAALPQAAQQRVFQPAPFRTRKVILATNIAETSVTLSGVRFVIDCGKSKIKQFRTKLGLDSLLVKPISQSSATQRKGRAGREAPGQCYRLYTEKDYFALPKVNTPEILRCDLSQAILTMKARGVNDIVGFPFLDRPPREALEKALMQLFQLGALNETGNISEIGLQIAKLPLSAPLGRVLLAAANDSVDCLMEVVDVISCLSVENIFLNITSEETKGQAEVARRALFRREGDHLTLLATVQAYAAEMADRKAWAERHFVSHRAMQAVMDVRKQLRAQCTFLRVSKEQLEDKFSGTTPEQATTILKCFLKGFANNTARLFPDGSYKTMHGNQIVAIHPSSILFGKKVEAIMYNEFVFTNRSYARGVSAVQMDWIGEAIGV